MTNKISSISYSTPTNGTQFTAGYGPDGLRAWKAGSNNNPTYFVYDGSQLLYEMTANGGSSATITAVNTWALPACSARNDLADNRESWYTFDAQGNVAQRLDASGQVRSTDSYDAYGQLLDGGDTSDPYGYKGEYGYYTDHETGLILCTHRYYDPGTGRWLTEDPSGYDGELNLYEYCEDDPINNNDENGLKYKILIATTDTYRTKFWIPANVWFYPGGGDLMDIAATNNAQRIADQFTQKYGSQNVDIIILIHATRKQVINNLKYIVNSSISGDKIGFVLLGHIHENYDPITHKLIGRLYSAMPDLKDPDPDETTDIFPNDFRSVTLHRKLDFVYIYMCHSDIAEYRDVLVGKNGEWHAQKGYYNPIMNITLPW